jgi:hypothetical protein
VYPPSEIFAKLVNKNAIKHQKIVASYQNFFYLYIPSLPKFGKNLIDPAPRISNRVDLCLSQQLYVLTNKMFTGTGVLVFGFGFWFSVLFSNQIQVLIDHKSLNNLAFLQLHNNADVQDRIPQHLLNGGFLRGRSNNT